jgi:hypothetical protein
MDTEKVPAKCAARLGQCFSATVDGAEVQWQSQQVVSWKSRVRRSNT